jgi:DJ-1/PfpI family
MVAAESNNPHHHSDPTSLRTVHEGFALPGRVANPEELRTDERTVHFVNQFAEAKKLIDADAVRGKKLTSWPSLRTDLKNAGADWVDQMVVVDRCLVTSRRPTTCPRSARRCWSSSARHGDASHDRNGAPARSLAKHPQFRLLAITLRIADDSGMLGAREGLINRSMPARRPTSIDELGGGIQQDQPMRQPSRARARRAALGAAGLFRISGRGYARRLLNILYRPSPHCDTVSVTSPCRRVIVVATSSP